MELPNSLSKVIQKYGRNPIEASHHPKQHTARVCADKILHEIASGIDDKGVLAYLWLAIEYDYNILVLSQERDAADKLIDALSAFIPRFKVVLDLPMQEQGPQTRLNFISSADPNTKNRKLEQLIGKLIPNMVLLKGSDLSLDSIFSSAKYGISFITYAQGDFYNRPTIKLLQSKRFGIEAKNISAMDISILLKKVNGTSTISAITEYKWFSEGEIRSKEGTITKSMENMKIMENGRLSSQIINSKVITKHSKSELINKEEALGDLKDRKEFLEHIYSTENGDDSIEMYYEIK
jgi:hypothetical protein